MASKMFLEIKLNVRTSSYESHRLISAEEVVSTHPTNMDLNAWSGGARPNSRFALTNNKGKFVYLRTEETNEMVLRKMAGL